MNDIIISLAAGCLVSFCFGFAVGLFAKNIIERNVKSDKTADNNLELWREITKKLNAPCLHTKRITRVVCSVVTCEATVEECADCGTVLTEIKTDC